MKKNKISTLLCQKGRPHRDFVNPPVTRAATILFDDIDHMRRIEDTRFDGKNLYYGRYGTTTTQMLCDALAEIESCDRVVVYPSGVAAISGVLSALSHAGDHILMTEGVYPNARRFCDEELAKYGIETTYYDALIDQSIERFIRPNTKIIYMESPASSTMEFQNIDTIVSVAKKRGLITIIDNTWASALRFRPLDLGVDISIQSATKHISGHSDILMGTVSGNGDLIQKIARHAVVMGYCVGADDAYLALRGLRTMELRLSHAENSARKIAQFLKSRPEIKSILHPEFDAVNQQQYQKYFSGGNGVFSFVLDGKFSPASIHAMIDRLQLFGLGFSWGGYESLIMLQSPNREFRKIENGFLIRLSIGFEDTDDLIADLCSGLDQLTESQTP